jgi:hypothetical protein
MVFGGVRIPDRNQEGGDQQGAAVVRSRGLLRSLRSMNGPTQISLWRLVMTGILAVAMSIPSWSHDWYDKRCCSNKDCAPATRIERLSSGGVYATSEQGTAYCSQDMFRPSADHQYHVCMRPGGFAPAMLCICLYLPGTS